VCDSYVKRKFLGVRGDWGRCEKIGLEKVMTFFFGNVCAVR
jgi:hypothetical protein